MKITVLYVIIFLLISFSGFSQERTPRVNKRQATQRASIAEGRASGDLTRREVAHLNHQQRHIRRSERRAKADGDITMIERRRLTHQQNRASRSIHRSKNNAMGRFQ